MKTRKGYFILEALLATVIFSMLILSLFSMISFLQRRTTKSTFESDAGLLMQDGMEIAHTALLASWSKYPDGIYSPAFDADSQNWTLVSGEETDLQALFTRKIELIKVCRDPSTGDRIETMGGSCGGKVDENSRLIKTTIEWSDKGATESVESSLLVFKLPE